MYWESDSIKASFSTQQKCQRNIKSSILKAGINDTTWLLKIYSSRGEVLKMSCQLSVLVSYITQKCVNVNFVPVFHGLMGTRDHTADKQGCFRNISLKA